MNVFHGTNNIFDSFDPVFCLTADHIYTTTQPDMATRFGHTVLEFDADLGRHFDMRLEHIYDDLGIEEFAVINEIFNAIGAKWGFSDFETFLMVVTTGGIFEHGGQPFQNAVFGEVFSRGYDSVRVTDAGHGDCIDDIIFANPARLVRVPFRF